MVRGTGSPIFRGQWTISPPWHIITSCPQVEARPSLRYRELSFIPQHKQCFFSVKSVPSRKPRTYNFKGDRATRPCRSHQQFFASALPAVSTSVPIFSSSLFLSFWRKNAEYRLSPSPPILPVHIRVPRKQDGPYRSLADLSFFGPTL